MGSQRQRQSPSSSGSNLPAAAPNEPTHILLPELKKAVPVPQQSNSTPDSRQENGTPQFALSRVQQQLPIIRQSISNGVKKPNSKDGVVCGISLAYLLKFAAKVPRDWTTEDVANCLIVPRTEQRKCRYVDLIPPKHVAKPDFFISHRWTSNFHNTITSIENHVSRVHPSPRTQAWVFIWMDIFSANQHVGLDDAQKITQSAISAASATLLCVDIELRIMSRLWCLYEIWLTSISKSQLVVLLRNIEWADLEKALSVTDIQYAECSREEDMARMHDHIKRMHAFNNFNDVIRQLVQTSMPKSSLTAYKLGQKQLELLKYKQEIQAQQAAKGPDYSGDIET